MIAQAGKPVSLLVLFAVMAGFGWVQAEPMPAFEVKTWIGDKTLTAERLKGRPYVVEFWATWCGPCRQTIPHLSKLNQVFEPVGVPIIGLTSEPKNKIGKVRAVANEFGMDYYAGFDEGLGRKLNVRSIPTAFVVGKDGEIAWRGHPMQKEFEQSLIKATREWLFPAKEFPKTGELAMNVVAGKSEKGVAELKQQARQRGAEEEPQKALALLESVAKREVEYAVASNATDPVAQILALRRTTDKYAGLDAAAKAAERAGEILENQSAKDPGFADEVAATERYREIQEGFRSKLDAALPKAKTMKDRLSAAVRVLKETVAEMDALIERYPKARVVPTVQAERKQMREAVKRFSDRLAKMP